MLDMTVGTEPPKPAAPAPVATPAASAPPAVPVIPASAPPVPAATPATAAVTPPAPASPAPAAADAPQSILADPKAPEAPAAETPKPADPAAPAVVEEFKLEAPKDSPLAASAVEKLNAWAKEAKIPKAEAQKLVDAMHAESLAGQTAAKAKADSDYKALYKTWGDELKADTEVGGERLADTVMQAKRTLRLFATPQERAFLEQTPFGNHPVLVKILARAGAKMSEDGFIGGGGNPPAPKTPAQTMYGTDHAKPSSFR